MDNNEPFSNQSDVTSPATSAFAITPHASDPLATVPKAVWVGTEGTLVVRMVDDASDVTFTAAKGWMPIRPTHVRATSTATDIVGVY